jgi:hypothetical protein
MRGHFYFENPTFEQKGSIPNQSLTWDTTFLLPAERIETGLSDQQIGDPLPVRVMPESE